MVTSLAFDSRYRSTVDFVQRQILGTSPVNSGCRRLLLGQRALYC